MQNFENFQLIQSFRQQLRTLQPKPNQVFVAAGILFTSLVAISPAFAHHPLGGRVPTNALEGFMSGLGHPVIGIDHLLFVIAAGLLAVTLPGGLAIPVSFVLTSLLGAGIHLMGVNLPMPELFISLSVLIFGLLLALGKQLNLATVVALSAAAGIFHGFAYGESIFGAEMGPLFAYLLGFATIQLAIALLAYAVGKSVLAKRVQVLRFAGFTILGAGAVFVSSTVLG